MESKVGFLGGMDRDSSLSKRNPNKYFEGMNIRVLTDDGVSTGSVINEKGNSLLFKMPASLGAIYAVPAQPFVGNNIGIVTSVGLANIYVYDTDINATYNAIISDSTVIDDIENGRYNVKLNDNLIYIIGLSDLTNVEANGADAIQIISPTSGFKIIGLGTMRDWVVVFTTDTKITPFDIPQSTPGNGQIWKCKYNAISGIEGLTIDNSLNPIEHLVYNGVLGFSINNRIGEIISRYQDESNGKIFFIDGVNTLKHINILNPDSIALPVSSLDTAPNVLFSQPKIKEVIKGGELRSGVIQYSYQLFNEGGTETSFAPASGLVHLTDSEEYNTYNSIYKGKEAGTSVNKSVVITVDNLDVSFDYIRFISIYYSSQEGAPEINILAEKSIPSNGSIQFIDTGVAIGVYAPAQYNTTGTRVMIPGTITAKNGYLVAANIKEEFFDVDNPTYWDARAYRWGLDSYGGFPVIGGKAFKVDGNTYNDYSLIENEADCVLSRADQEIYKYTQNSSELGGDGINISYNFKLIPLKIDVDIDDLSIFTDKDTTYQAWNSKLGDSFSNNTSYTSYASPINKQQLVGYTRDEVYRFGIVFFDNKGRQSFVKWVADIKMPAINDVDVKNTYRVDNANKKDYNTVFRQTIPGTDLNTKTLLPGIYANVLGVEFTVNNIPAGLSYKIVRVRREQNDKYILGQGLMGVTKREDGDNYVSVNSHLVSGSTTTDNVASYLDSVVNYPNIITFKSPEVLYIDSIKPVKGDKVKIVGLTDSVSYAVKNSLLEDYKHILVRKIKSLTPISPIIGEVADGSIVSDTLIDNADYRYVINNNFGITRFLNHGNAWKGTTLAVGLDTTAPFLYPLIGLVSSYNYMILNYTKDPSIVQYGGNTYTSRINNIYIGCGNLSTSNTSLVFGGDTYIGMFEYLNAMLYTGHAGPSITSDAEKMEVVYIPLESTINVELMHGTSFSKDNADYRLCETKSFGDKAAIFGDSDFGIYPANYTDVYQYNLTYSADPIGKTFTVKPQFFKNNQVNDYRIIVSEKHINNQLVDNWTKFLYNNLIEVNSAYGSINKIITFRNRLFFFQDNAFGIVGFEDRQLLKDNTGLPLVLGTGGILSNFQYISEKTGTKSKFGVIDTGTYLYFVDLNNKKFMRFNGDSDECVSDKDNFSSFFRTFNYGDILITDSTANGVGIHGVFDPVNKRVLYTMLGEDSTTFSFNEVLDNFESFYDFKPTIYENTDFGVISINPDNIGECYLHNSGKRGVFYGTAYDSYITHIVSPNPDNKKVFNNLEFNSYVQVNDNDVHDRTINNIQLWNSFQDTGNIVLTEPSNIRRRFRTWRYQIPRVGSLRLTDYFLYTKLSFTNSISEDTYFRLDDITVHYLLPMI